MIDKVYVPPLKNQGIKTKLVPLIRQHVVMENGAIWIEPFMGSGVVGFNIEPEKAIFADINPYIIEFYNQIKLGIITPEIVRSYLEKEGKLLAQMDEQHYYFVRERFNKEHAPLDFLFLNRSCFNGMMRFNKEYVFNVPYGHKPERFSKGYITKIVNQILHVSFLLKSHSWEFICQPFEETIGMARENDFIYCDPPYIGRHVDYYDSWDESEEIALHQALVESNAKFMLSTWHHNDFRKNEYISSVWQDCEVTTKEHFYHVGAKEKNRNPVVEALLTNYPLNENTKMKRAEGEQLNLFDTLTSK